MKALILDISSSTGWCILEGEKGTKPSLLQYGTVINPKKKKEFGEYPWSYILAAHYMVFHLNELIDAHNPDVIVIEETNKGKNRYSQKYLEYIHCLLLESLKDTRFRASSSVFYVSTGDWRKNQGCVLTKEDAKNNRKVKKAKDEGKSKKEAGVKGKIGRKHVAIRHANDQYSLNLKVKDDDIADAICVGLAYFNNVKLADGT